MAKYVSAGLIWPFLEGLKRDATHCCIGRDGSLLPALHCADQPLWENRHGMKKVMFPDLRIMLARRKTAVCPQSDTQYTPGVFVNVATRYFETPPPG